MFDLIKARLKHGYQAIPDNTKAKIATSFPGLPIINAVDGCNWSAIEQVCPSSAIENQSIDMGKCVFCGECSRKYPDVINFTNNYKISTDRRELLIIDSNVNPDEFRQKAISEDRNLAKILGRSFKLRSVSAGGCGACELELNACGNVNFDMGRYGIDIVASPRHSDGVIITGPISKNMAYALQQTWDATPEPKVLILAGACAISGGLFADSPALDRSFLERVPAVLFIPGCPIHPLTIINGLLQLLGRSK